MTAGCFSTADELILAARRKSTILAKPDLIASLCKGKTVLDIGCIDESLDAALEQGDEWLHARIATVAREAVGLDMLEDAATELRGQGYNIVVGDAESFELGRTFEVIVAADVIEHLSNVGRFLEATKRHMQECSVLVITTPNAFNAETMLRAMNMGKVECNPSHTQWLDPRTIFNVVSRHGYIVQEFYWIDTRFHNPIRPIGRVRNRILNWFAGRLFEHRPICRRDFAIVCGLR